MSLRTGWTPEKDRNLINMRNDDGLNWLQISRALPGHDADECRTHYEYITGYESASIRGDPWTEVELADLWVLLHGKNWLAGTDWEYISSHFDDRPANECKARWAMQMQEQGPPSAMNRRHILQQTAIEGSVDSNAFIMTTEDSANRQSQHLPETNDTRQQELDVFMSQSDIEVLLGETSNVTFVRDSALTRGAPGAGHPDEAPAWVWDLSWVHVADSDYRETLSHVPSQQQHPHHGEGEQAGRDR